VLDLLLKPLKALWREALEAERLKEELDEDREVERAESALQPRAWVVCALALAPGAPEALK
jgi:hypothetical protein